MATPEPTRTTAGATLIAHCGVDSDSAVIEQALREEGTWTQWEVTTSTTELNAALTRHHAALRTSSAGTPIVVMPLTSGRNLTLIADTAKVCQWFTHTHPEAPLLLAPAPLHDVPTVAWLRAALRTLTTDADLAVICSAAIDPFADAELFRLARLAWTNSSGADVLVAFDDAYPSISQVVAPHQALAAASASSQKIAVIRADLRAPEGQTPLLRSRALSQAIAASLANALHLYRDHGDNGIAAALLADHAHGYAHSHGEDSHSHGHTHHHSHGHGHGHHSHTHHHSQHHHMEGGGNAGH